jgi:hypothetical protein
VYGAKGYAVAGDSQSIPNFATFSVSNQNGLWTWITGTSDSRALQTGNNSGRIAAAWYKNHESFVIDVNFTDSQSHGFALYAVDWDSQGRSESIQILDAVTGQILDTEMISNFSNGIYLIWNISGHVTINITDDVGANAIVNGVFFQ